ncbi:MAG: Arc family DNA-binding protein, partial [Rhizobiales bacterium]|nr:Arc family DNA-binding protein [Hyphomicrobiales bacterium]
MANGGDEIRLTLRLPAELRDRLATSAERSSRSMNGEIVSRLERSLEPLITPDERPKDKYLDTMTAWYQGIAMEAEALRTSSMATERLLMDLVSSIMKAASGNPERL